MINSRQKTVMWDELLGQFEAHLQQSGLAQNTIDGYLRDVKSFSVWLSDCVAGGEGTDSTVTFSSNEIKQYKQYLRDTLGRSPSTINRALQSLRKFGHFTLRKGLHPSNPARDVRLLAKPEASSPKVLSDAEVQRLVTAARARRSEWAARDYAILQLLLQTGIRICELVRLRETDVLLREDGDVLNVQGWRKRSGRRLPLNETAASALRDYLSQPRPPNASHLFLSRDGGPLSARSVQRIVSELGKAAKMDISATILRDTYARSLWEKTGDLSLLIERLGYKRPETVLKYISSPARNEANDGAP